MPAGAPRGNTNRRIGVQPLDAQFGGRCYRREKAGWVKAARKRGVGLVAFMRAACTDAARKDGVDI